jgi:hypothetical protein
MKPLQVALLVVVSAVIGGLFMKWQISRNMARVAAVAPVAAVAQPAAAVHPVTMRSQPVEPVEAPPVAEHKAAIVNARPNKATKSRQAAPVMMARIEEPPAVQAPAETPPAAVSQPQPPIPPLESASEQPVQYPEPAASSPAPVQPAAPLQVTLKAGTLISARTVEALSSEHNAAGDGFSATLDHPLVADGWVIAERGARLEGKVVEAGRGSGQSHLVLALTQLRTSDGQRVPIETETFSKQAQASTGESAAKVAAGAVLGAAIGAIAGGGKGAAIGAGAGTAAGAAGAAATRSKAAALPPETLIQFRLKNSITITERQGRN